MSFVTERLCVFGPHKWTDHCHAGLAQSVARQSHNLKVVSSSLTFRIIFFFSSPETYDDFFCYQFKADVCHTFAKAIKTTVENFCIQTYI